MKLGIDCRDLRAGLSTGIGRFVRNLLQAVSMETDPPKLFLYGNQHTDFGAAAGWGKPLNTRHRRATEAATWWWDKVSLPRMVRHDRLDAFLSPYFKAPGIRSCPMAITIHDLLFLRMPPEVSGRSAMYCRAFRSFAASFARRADAVLTVSEHSRRDIIDLLNVPRGKTCVIGNCVGPPFQPIADQGRIEAARAACGVAPDYLLYVGNFGPHKNVDGLLQAYAETDDNLRNRFQLVLAGRSDKWVEKTHNSVRRLDLADHVRFTDHVPDEHLPPLYAGAAAFVTLSMWEGFGLPVIEAMACGTPVLCSNRAALAEVADGAALLVDPRDTADCAGGLSRILTDDDLRTELRRKGLERAAQFSPKLFAERTLAAINTIAEGRA